MQLESQEGMNELVKLNEITGEKFQSLEKDISF